MKKLISLSTVIVLFGTLFLASCAKEDDPQVTPPKFTGNWYVSETSTDFGHSTYNCTISDSSNASHILFAYLYGFNKKVFATVSGSNFTIPTQIIPGYSVSGSGVLSNTNRIDMTYLVKSTATHYDTVRAVLTK